ncbi:Glycosyl transferase family 2 [Clostridium sp. USBA 49]|jgi:GT2 family glycosyltransferase|uniref:glycosyltransferase family 2 protein n=2 Tax=Clostridium TaxID=1485 RepID=UPI00099ABBC6|nr:MULTISPECIES: glycosyltransferase family 2 protein [Clostridium]SKA88254.1 Glycosyl transferase family 2 [Clostridium sp. USBA 49]
MDLKKVTVIIPTRNEEKYIGKCLDSFVNQSYPKELYEIFVVDGLSEDKTTEIVKEYNKKYKNIQLIINPGRIVPKGVNLGIKKSSADIIILFGAHAYADKDFIKENVISLENEEVGCSGGPITTISHDLKGAAIALAMSSPFGVGNALFRYAQKEIYVDTVAFGAYKREVLEKVGYLDEELVRNQDDELNYRVIKNGYKILLSPKIKSTYYSRSSFKKLWNQYYQYGFWKVRVMQKHGKTASLRHLIPMAFVIYNLLGLILSLINHHFMYLWLPEIAIYILLDILFSFKLSNKNKKLLKYLPFVFPMLHISYGLGFIEGLFSFYLLKNKRAVEKNTKLSR